MFAASTACCTSMPNSTTLRKNCSRFWSWVSPPCTANARNGFPSFRARLGVSVTRGRFDRCGAAPERFVKRGQRRGVLGAGLGRRHGTRRPLLQERQIGIRAALERIRIPRLDVGIVVIRIDELRALARVLL